MLACAGHAGATSFGDIGCLQDPTASPTASATVQCVSHPQLQTVAAVGVSDDGRFVYAGTFGGELTVFSRDAFGGLKTVQCLSSSGSNGACTAVPNLPQESITDVEVSGANVYVGTHDGVVSAFARDVPSGTLTAVGCVAGSGSGTSCTEAQRSGAGNISTSWVAPTSNVVYAGGEPKNGMAVTMYDRAGTGALSQSPADAADTSYCISDNGGADQGPAACAYVQWAINTFSLAFNSSGTRAYATSNDDQTLMAFDRAAGGRALSTPGTCIGESGTTDCPNNSAKGLDDPTDVVVSPTTGNVYVSSPSSSTIAVFRPDLSEIGCIAQAGTANANSVCGAQAHGIDGADGLALSPDGNHLYVVGSTSQSVAELSVGANGMLSQPAAVCVSSAGASGCGADTALDTSGGGTTQWDVTAAIATSRPNSAFAAATPTLYVAAPGSSALHTFSISARERITLPTHTVKCTSATCQLILRCSREHDCLVTTTLTVFGVKAKAKAKPIVVASGHFTVPKGKSKPLRARTTKAGRKLLKTSRAHHRKKLSGQLTVQVKGAARASTFRVTLRP